MRITQGRKNVYLIIGVGEFKHPEGHFNIMPEKEGNEGTHD
jgi:hypothetical protein